MPSIKKPIDILKATYGYSDFRPAQLEIITSALKGQDVVAILPTAGGKSLCYQIPALCTPGICIVVSPLIALINDQVHNLKKRGVKALGITSGIKKHDLDALLDNCIYGSYKFLYLSPERLQQPLVRERIAKMKVNFIAIDEAHCISEWGHDFRPAYLKIADLKELLPDVPQIAVTATATLSVLESIKKELHLKQPKVFTASFKRKQIEYHFSKTPDKSGTFLQFYKHHKGSSITYLRSRKNTTAFASLLQHHRVSAAVYHGGLNTKLREASVKKWLDGSTQVMVATNAFGMGIDKPDVRSIVHMQIPDSIESYYQETGRAGRDGNMGIAKFIYNDNDIIHARNQFIRALPTPAYLKKVYRHLSNFLGIAYGEGKDIPQQLPFAHFCRQYDLNGIATYNALVALDRFSVLSLDQNYGNRSELRFRESGNRIIAYTSHRPQAHAIVQSILRTYGSSKEHNIQLNVKLIATRSNTTEDIVVETLKDLHEKELVWARVTGTDTSITYLEPREDDRTINRFSRELDHYNKVKSKKLEEMIALLDQSSCTEIAILKYFGEKHAQPCGRCNHCRSFHKKNPKTAVLNLLKEQDHDLNTLTRITKYPQEQLLKAIRELLDSGRISIIAPQTYRSNE